MVDLSYYKWDQSQTLDIVSMKTLDPLKGWIVRSGKRNIPYKGIETFSY